MLSQGALKSSTCNFGLSASSGPLGLATPCCPDCPTKYPNNSALELRPQLRTSENRTEAKEGLYLSQSPISGIKIGPLMILQLGRAI
jgi:hypothetical protein